MERALQERKIQSTIVEPFVHMMKRDTISMRKHYGIYTVTSWHMLVEHGHGMKVKGLGSKYWKQWK